ncbi:MAG TPA: cob(I)yrinic acid a,c-diamide adenosyltransferase, partial [Gammaproteobacteria bacterium]|nr:cob(I)yrinic acid a,c-diamide adenosyltransferase [Gammaproteobacteria bacterium]
IPGYSAITPEHITRLENELDGFNEHLPPLQEFILPGGSRAAAACHLARTICRRAERRTYTLSTGAAVRPEALHYLNRLSDLLFVLARVIARHDKGTEVLWSHERKKS